MNNSSEFVTSKPEQEEPSTEDDANLSSDQNSSSENASEKFSGKETASDQYLMENEQGEPKTVASLDNLSRLQNQGSERSSKFSNQSDEIDGSISERTYGGKASGYLSTQGGTKHMLFDDNNNIFHWWNNFWDYLFRSASKNYPDYPESHLEHIKRLVNQDPKAAINLLYKLQSEVHQLQSDVHRLRDQINSINSSRWNERNSRIRDLETEVQALRHEVESSKKENENLNRRVISLQAEKKDLEMTNQNLESRCSKLMAELAKYTRDPLANPSGNQPQHHLLRSDFLQLRNSEFKSLADATFDYLKAQNPDLGTREKRLETPIILSVLSKTILVDGLKKLQSNSTDEEDIKTGIYQDTLLVIGEYLKCDEDSLSEELKSNLSRLVETSYTFLLKMNHANPPGELWVEEIGQGFNEELHELYATSPEGNTIVFTVYPGYRASDSRLGKQLIYEKAQVFTVGDDDDMKDLERRWARFRQPQDSEAKEC